MCKTSNLIAHVFPLKMYTDPYISLMNIIVVRDIKYYIGKYKVKTEKLYIHSLASNVEKSVFVPSNTWSMRFYFPSYSRTITRQHKSVLEISYWLSGRTGPWLCSWPIRKRSNCNCKKWHSRYRAITGTSSTATFIQSFPSRTLDKQRNSQRIQQPPYPHPQAKAYTGITIDPSPLPSSTFCTTLSLINCMMWN